VTLLLLTLKALRYPFVVVVGCLLIAPTLMTILISFTSGTILFFPPPGYGTRWYANFFERPEWVSGALTSLQVGLVVMAVSTVLGTLTALAIQRGRFPGRDLLIALVLSPIIAPSVIVGLGMYVLYLRLHPGRVITRLRRRALRAWPPIRCRECDCRTAYGGPKR